MKQSLYTLGVLGLCLVAGSAQAQTGQRQAPPTPKPAAAMNDHTAVETTIKANEQKINDAFMKKDVATITSLIAADAVGVDPSGVASIGDMLKQLPSMDMKMTNVKLSNFAFHWIDDNNVVLTYTWSGQGTVMGQPVPSPTFGSTLWSKKGGKWWAVFHQETAAMAMPPVKK